MRKWETKDTFQGKKLLNAEHKHEVPETDFGNSYNSPKVELVSFLNRDFLYYAMFTFIMGSYGNSPHKREEMNPTIEEMEQVIEACLNGEALPLAMEIPVFTFKISGIDRIITHQIVRSRIGVTFSQHCTGDNDVRHVDYLVPHRMQNANDAEEIEYVKRVKKHLLEAKRLYAEAIDNYDYSIQDARHILPQCLDTYIYMHCNYIMLRNFVGRRFCVNETPQMQVICKKIKEAVTEISPLLGKYLTGICDVTKQCHFKKHGSVFGGSVCFSCGKWPRIGLDGEILENDPKAYIHPGRAREFRRTTTEGERVHFE